jgi:CheY-like chemotaxis protein
MMNIERPPSSIAGLEVSTSDGPHPQTHAGQQPAILLAYSGRDKREYLAAFLASRDYDVTACINGREALACVAIRCFDLVVTGIVMPCLDGLELMRALRRRHANLPVIAMANSADKINRVYLRYARLSGAVATHTFCETEGPFLKSVEGILAAEMMSRAALI